MVYNYPTPSRRRRSNPLLWIAFLLLAVVWLWFYIGGKWNSEKEIPVAQEMPTPIAQRTLPEAVIEAEDSLPVTFCCEIKVMYSDAWGLPTIIFPPNWEFFILQERLCEQETCWAEVYTYTGLEEVYTTGWILLSGGESWERSQGKGI